jgi:hypothetical protein
MIPRHGSEGTCEGGTPLHDGEKLRREVSTHDLLEHLGASGCELRRLDDGAVASGVYAGRQTRYSTPSPGSRWPSPMKKVVLSHA